MRVCFKIVGLLLVACLVGLSSTEAGTLVLGGTDGTFVNVTAFGNNLTGAGGNFQPNTLDGVTLPYLYCVSVTTDISVPGTYTSVVTTDGTIFGTPLTNAGEVAWLLTNLAPSATTGDAESGLQSAIWSVLYGSNYNLGTGNPADVYTYAAADLAALGTNTAPLSDLIWLSNYDSYGNHVQPFIALNSDPDPGPIPEPSSIVLGLIGALGIAGYSSCRRVQA